MTGTRTRAADLVAAIRRGAVPEAALEDWPRDPDDRALRAVGTMLEGLGPDAASAHRALLDRCESFLRSGTSYEWPVDDFGVPVSAGPRWLPVVLAALAAGAAAFRTTAGFVVASTLVVAAVAWFPLDRRLRREWAALERRLEAAGDRDAWPFLRRAEVPTRDG